MSTETGDAKVVADAVAEARAILDDAQQVDAQQLDLLEPVSPEDMFDAREALGPDAGQRTVLRYAREKKRGRPPGARNKRTDDFKRYLLGFGPHPAVTMMQIQSTAPEVLQANSRRKVTEVIKGKKDEADRVVEYEVETMTYEAAQSLRVRCAEGLLPYLESKLPVAVDMNFSGIGDLFIEGVTHTADEMASIQDGDFMTIDDDAGEGEP